MLRTAHRIFTAFSANLATLPLVVMGRAGKSRARAGLRKIASGRRALGLGPGPNPSLVVGTEDGLFPSCPAASPPVTYIWAGVTQLRPSTSGALPSPRQGASQCHTERHCVDTGEGKKARVNALLDHSPYTYVCVCTLPHLFCSLAYVVKMRQ